MTRKGTAPDLPAWLTTLVPFERYTLSLSEHTMHVMESGPADGRPVLLVHGNPTWGFLYRKVALALKGSGLRCIMPDLIGLGLSSRPRHSDDHTLENHSGWIRECIRALDLRDVIVVVQDWGGPIGTLAFAEDADRVAGLVVMNTVLGPPRDGFKPTLFHRFSQAPVVSDLVFRGLSFPQAMLSIAQGDRSSIRGIVSRAYRYPLRSLDLRDAPLALARMVPDSMHHRSIAPLRQCQAFVESLDVPTAMVWGHKDPVLGSTFRHMCRITHPSHIIETDAGHFLQEEVPDEIAEAIRYVADAASVGRS